MTQKSTPAQIVAAIKSEDVEVIEALFHEYPDQVLAFTPFAGETWLGYAAGLGKLKSTTALVNLGLDVNAGDKRDNVRPISSAASGGHYDVAEYLLTNGAQLDESSSVCNPLFSAIVGRSPEIVELLLQAGVNSKIVYNTETMKNMDAVAFALMRGEKECANIIALWNAGGDAEAAKIALNKAERIAEENAR